MIKIKLNSENAKIPEYKTRGASCFDLSSCEEVTIPSGKTMLVNTGLIFQLPMFTELQIRPRSGMSLNSGLIITNSPGTIDSDYRGEVKIIMTNIGSEDYTIKVGDRIAQGLIQRVEQTVFIEVKEIEGSERGSGGFGSTGA